MSVARNPGRDPGKGPPEVYEDPAEPSAQVLDLCWGLHYSYYLLECWGWMAEYYELSGRLRGGETDMVGLAAPAPGPGPRPRVGLGTSRLANWQCRLDVKRLELKN